MTVGLALVGIVLWGTLVGSLLPFVLRRLGFDPATSSAPFVATLVDVTGLVIYFSVAPIQSTFDIEALRGEKYAYVEVTWEGETIPSAVIDSWLDEPLQGVIANRQARQILEQHGSELWSRPKDDNHACLRLPLRLPARPLIHIALHVGPRAGILRF